MLLGKTVFRIRQKGVPPLLLPASLLQLPRCLTRTYNLTSYDTTLFELDSFKKCNCSMKNISANLICFANVGLLAHTSPTFLKKLLDQKTFICLGLVFCNKHLYIFLPIAHTTFITTEKEGVPYGKFHWARGIPLLASHPHPCNGCHCRRKRRARADVCLLRPHLF